MADQMHCATNKRSNATRVTPPSAAVAPLRHYPRRLWVFWRAWRNKRFALLLEEGTTTVDRLKVCLAGPPYSGKTTLISSLCTTKAQSIFRLESSRSADFSGITARTAGISQTVAKLKDTKSTVTEFCFTDIGG